MHIPEIFIQYIKDIAEIAILWVVFYKILLFFEGTRAFLVLRGITYLILACLISKLLGLEVLYWLLLHFLTIGIIAILVIFQHELRAGLARLGQQHLFVISLEEPEIKALINEIYDTVVRLSKSRTGCLIAIEREMKLDLYVESGIVIDGKVSSALLQSIFSEASPLHDGGVVIRGERVAASTCLFPLSDNPRVGKTVGTRHRAALGLSEHTDALVVLVSEETGEISIAVDGHFMPIHDAEHFAKQINQILVPAKRAKREKLV